MGELEVALSSKNGKTDEKPEKSKGIGVRVPGVLSDEAKKFLDLSGFVSVSDLVRAKLRLWTQNCKSIGLDLTEAQKQRKSTLQNLLPIWVANFRENLPEIHAGKDISAIEKPKKGSFIVVGAGPSIKRLNHINMLGVYKYKGTVIASDRILSHCIAQGVIPDYVVCLDCDPVIKKFIDNKIVRSHQSKIKAVMATTVDPSVVKAWKGEKYFFNAQIDYVPNELSVSNFMQIMSSTNNPYASQETAIKEKKGKSILNTCGGNVGSTCWGLATYLLVDYNKEKLKKYPIGLIGLDFGWPADIPLTDTDYYPAYYKMANGDSEKIKENYKKYHNPFFNNDHNSCKIFDLYRKTFSTWIEGTRIQDRVQTINCTGGGALFCDLIPQMHFEDFLQKYRS